MHVEGVEATTAALVAELPAGGPPIAWVLAGSPCRSIFVPVVVGQHLGHPPRWERLAALTDDHRPVLVAREADLAATLRRPGGSTNRERWQMVADTLGQLGV